MADREKTDDFARYFRWLPIVMAIGILAFLATRPARAPAPANQIVFGCYLAPDAPAILLGGAGMRVRQDGYPVIPFHLERHKAGIVLAADAPIRADKTGESYRFGMDERGIGRFLPFYRTENGRTYGVFEEELLAGFQMLASDDGYLSYEPADAARCA